jgi:hypothetical protein
VAFETLLVSAHELSSHHAHLIRKSARCGCFYCLTTYEPSLISEWIDDADTAICPFCGIDAVIGDASGFPVTEIFLSAMHKFWFAEEADADNWEDAMEADSGEAAS